MDLRNCIESVFVPLEAPALALKVGPWVTLAFRPKASRPSRILRIQEMLLFRCNCMGGGHASAEPGSYLGRFAGVVDASSEAAPS